MRKSTSRKSRITGKSTNYRKKIDWDIFFRNTVFDLAWPPDTVRFQFVDSVQKDVSRIKALKFSNKQKCIAVVVPVVPPNLFHLHLWLKLKELAHLGVDPLLIFNDTMIAPSNRDRFSQDVLYHTKCIEKTLGRKVIRHTAGELIKTTAIADLMEKLRNAPILPCEESQVNSALLAISTSSNENCRFIISAEMNARTFKPVISHGAQSLLLAFEPVPIYLPLLCWDSHAALTVADSKETVKAKLFRHLGHLETRCSQEAFCMEMYRYFYCRGQNKAETLEIINEDLPIGSNISSVVDKLAVRWRGFVEDLGFGKGIDNKCRIN